MIHRRVSGPAVEPITLDQARAHLREPDTAADVRIQALISVARQQAEDATSRALAPQRWLAVLDAFPTEGCCGIRLPAPPITQIVSVTYVSEVDGSTVALTSTDWQLDSDSEPCWLFPAYGKSWPTARVQPGAVRVTLDCGYPLGQLPKTIGQWMLLQIAHWYENTQATADQRYQALPFADALLAPFTCLIIE